MKDQIKTILSEWESRKLPHIIPRNYNLKQYLNLKVPKIIALTGFRRSGKTFLVFELIKNLLKTYSKKEIIYINFEDERIPLKTEFLTELIPSIKEYFGIRPRYLFLDEIQNIPNWSKWLRRIYDTLNIKIFVTGSSSKLSKHEIPTELRGRSIEQPIYPLSFNEFLRFKNLVFNRKKFQFDSDFKAKIMHLFDEYLNWGGLPEVVLETEPQKQILINNYYASVVKSDIKERFKLQNEELLKTLIKLLFNTTYYSISSLYNNLKSLNLKAGKTTILNYLSYIEQAYFMNSLTFFSYKLKDQLQYKRKVYFIDNAFINFLAVKAGKNQGRLLENLIYFALLQKFPTSEIHYWQDSLKNKEVDFVVKKNSKVTKLIQVCYDLNNFETQNREIKSLIKASKELNCPNLLIITLDETKEIKFKNYKIKAYSFFDYFLG
jgi:hypothetical protein